MNFDLYNAPDTTVAMLAIAVQSAMRLGFVGTQWQRGDISVNSQAVLVKDRAAVLGFATPSAREALRAAAAHTPVSVTTAPVVVTETGHQPSAWYRVTDPASQVILWDAEWGVTEAILAVLQRFADRSGS